MRKYLVFLLIPLMFSSPSFAAPSQRALQNEIIYRVHLGRASDVELLLKQGAKPNHTNREGIHLLALASERSDKEAIAVIDALLKGGADIDQRDTLGQTALFHAARINNVAVVEHLLANGIDYYIVDNNGDVARNIAHREGFDDLVKLMDQFVIELSKNMNKKYEAYNRVLEEQYEEQKRIVEEHERMRKEAFVNAYNEAVLLDSELEEEYQKALAEMERIELERQQTILKKRASKSFQDNLKTLAYQMCGFQYWSYTKALKQTTEIKDEALDRTIASHYENVMSLTALLYSEYSLQQDYITGVTQRAQARIVYELEQMPSKTYRFQNGVGRISDMEARCGRIAKYWNAELSKKRKTGT